MYLKRILPAILLITCTAGYSQTVNLVLEKGKKYELLTSTKVSTTASLMGQEMETIMNNESTNLVEVKDARATEFDISSTLKKLNTNMSGMGQEMSYNSEDKNNSGPLADELGKRVDKVKNYTVDKNGNTIKEDKSTPDEDISGPATSALLKQEGLVVINKKFLGRELKAGNSWPDTSTVNEDKMKTTTIGAYMVKSIDKGIAVIAFNGTQNITGTVEQMGQEMTITGTNKIVSETSIDMVTGIMISSKATIDMSNSIDVGGMSIPTKGTTTINNTVKAL